MDGDDQDAHSGTCVLMALHVDEDAIDVVLDARATIGESPLWSPQENALYWVDIKAPALHRFRTLSGDTQRWPLTSDIGGFALVEDEPAAVVALRQGLYRLDLRCGTLVPLAPAPFDPAVFRFNEGACDVNGRLWIGVMCDPIRGPQTHRKSALHSFTLSGGLRREADVSDLHNGMAWSADGRSFYLSHSYDQKIFQFSYRPADGRLADKRLFATLPEPLGIPDGAAIDAENGYWCACHGGGRLRRFKPDGRWDRDISLPVSQPTMCTFGGKDMDELYVTTSRDNLTSEQLKREPLAGALLRLRPGGKGLLRHCFVR
jgi:sugar lactone lactonase YvrE